MDLKDSVKKVIGGLIREYYKWDQAEKEAKKQKQPLNKQIKEIMKEEEIRDILIGEIKATYIEKQVQTADAEKLLQRLKDLGATDCIKTVEVVNEEALEDAIYNGKISPAMLEDCFSVKVVPTLTVKKASKKEIERFNKLRGEE